MKRHTFIYIIISLFFLTGYGQERQLRKADKNYERYAYIDAITVYEQVVKEGHRSAELFKKLGNSYYFNADLMNACKWYRELFSMEGVNITSEYYFRYAQSLKAGKNYTESDAMMEKFKVLSGSDKRGQNYNLHRNYLEEIESNSGRFKIKNIDVNSINSDFAPSFYDGGLVFSSSRNTKVAKRFIHTWNNKPFLNLYGSKISSDFELSNVIDYSNKLNTRYHESTSSFSKDGNIMYFTRNNYNRGKYRKDVQGTNKLKIYRTYKENDKWSTPEELPFNSDEYSVAHPALSPDENRLYFASDMPGTIGQSDLYVVSVYEDGSFSEPINLGEEINTEGRETFPFISKSNELYFASDGHVGLGGLDVFVSQLGVNNDLGDIYNIGTPVNSEKDDFSFIINSATNLGYFASNRTGGVGDDDIYSLVQLEPLTVSCEQQLVGVVMDEGTNEILDGSEVLLRNKDNEIIETVYSDEDGRFVFKTILDCSDQYFVRASKATYSTTELLVPLIDTLGLREVTLTLDRVQTEIKEGTDLALILNIPIIYFDFDESTIRPDAVIALAKVIAAMKQNPDLHIDVRSHTDSRGKDEYNMKLSNRRNIATINWIIQQGGIDASRVNASGYGETAPKNKCSNGVKCSKEAHQLNRRSEFIIIRH